MSQVLVIMASGKQVNQCFLRAVASARVGLCWARLIHVHIIHVYRKTYIVTKYITHTQNTGDDLISPPNLNMTTIYHHDHPLI